MSIIVACRSENVECVARQDCFAESVGMPMYCSATLATPTNTKTVGGPGYSGDHEADTAPETEKDV